MIKDLIKLADQLDKAGLNREAEFTDKMIAKLAQEVGSDSVVAIQTQHRVEVGETMTSITESYTSGTGKTLADNIDLNKKKDPNFDPDMIQPKSIVWIWTPQEGADGTLGEH